MELEEIIKQANFTKSNLKSSCEACNKKAIEFWDAVIQVAEQNNILGKELFFSEYIIAEDDTVIIKCSCNYNAERLAQLLEELKLSK